ncbi:PBP1b-binding outer membrane lipoprotein LpoB [Breznakia sp. PF5-3]|uniref:hypothetical protein n=1 Tax=unclassified Breznakia TaxID=2623764 RepID=UPI0024068E8E|nr:MULTISPECIES: hypothetical protein [unclassified Breznakia]MDF9825113.1 PBP1b-binding outer membrane lipoprotein LpoB [Breznakia sp. PM6-1]MDF9835960.1 PBP1b-binding outer membrane lipoprotein LpoB [Breznakia sp. PF5-3]
MKKVVMIFSLILVLAGCGGESKAKEVTCKLDYGSSEIVDEVTATYDGDKKVEKIIVTREAALADYLFEDYEIEELEELYKNDYINPNKKQKGLEFDISVDKKKKKLSVKIEIDPSKASEGDVKELGIKEYKNIKKLVKELEAEEYSCGKIE